MLLLEIMKRELYVTCSPFTVSTHNALGQRTCKGYTLWVVLKIEHNRFKEILMHHNAEKEEKISNTTSKLIVTRIFIFHVPHQHWRILIWDMLCMWPMDRKNNQHYFLNINVHNSKKGVCLILQRANLHTTRKIYYIFLLNLCWNKQRSMTLTELPKEIFSKFSCKVKVVMIQCTKLSEKVNE